MKDFDIDNYLADMTVAIDDLGGCVNLVGLCQGGWLSAMIAARFPNKVNSLVLAGAPIDTDAGDGSIKRMVKELPMSFYEGLVELGGGVMRGKYMLQGWKNMHPAQRYIQDDVDLYEHIDDPVYLAKEETFASWYENPVDLPGRWYLQAIEQLFKENRLAKGKFVGLVGRSICATSGARHICSPARRRHHHARTGAECRHLYRDAQRDDRAQDRAGWTYRSIHGIADPERGLAHRSHNG